MIDDIAANHSIDKGRMLLGGWSGGGWTRVVPLTVFPNERLVHCPLLMHEFLAQRLSDMTVLRVEPVGEGRAIDRTLSWGEAQAGRQTRTPRGPARGSRRRRARVTPTPSSPTSCGAAP